MLRKITFVLSIIFTAACFGLEKRTIAAEGFFCEAVKSSFSEMALKNQGRIHYVLSSVPVKAPELAIVRAVPKGAYKSRKYAVYGHILVVNTVNSNQSISLSDARKILSNRFPAWPEVGVRVPMVAVADGAIPRHIVQKMQAGSKTRVAIFPDAASAAKAVSMEVGAVGILPLGFAPYNFPNTRILAIDRVQPTPKTVFSGKYPLCDLYYICISQKAGPEIRKLYNEWNSKKFRYKILKTGALPIL